MIPEPLKSVLNYIADQKWDEAIRDAQFIPCEQTSDHLAFANSVSDFASGNLDQAYLFAKDIENIDMAVAATALFYSPQIYGMQTFQTFYKWLTSPARSELTKHPTDLFSVFLMTIGQVASKNGIISDILQHNIQNFQRMQVKLNKLVKEVTVILDLSKEIKRETAAINYASRLFEVECLED